MSFAMRAGELTVPLAGCSTQESRSCTSPGKTVELALVEGEQVSWSSGCEHKRTGPATHLL